MEQTLGDANWIERLAGRPMARYRRREAVNLPEKRRSLAVVEGMVQIIMLSSEGRERDLMVLRPGDLFSEPQALADGIESTHLLAYSLTDCAVTHLSDADIVGTVVRDPSLIVEFLSRSARNTERLLMELERIAFSNSVALIAAVLAERSQSGLSVALSQEKLAQITGKTRVTVANALHRLRGQNIISLERSKIRITDREALLEVARGG